MVRVSVHLPDELAVEAQAAGLDMSAVLQEALRRTLAGAATNRWLESVHRQKDGMVSHEQALAALDAARDEAPTRHG